MRLLVAVALMLSLVLSVVAVSMVGSHSKRLDSLIERLDRAQDDRAPDASASSSPEVVSERASRIDEALRRLEARVAFLERSAKEEPAPLGSASAFEVDELPEDNDGSADSAALSYDDFTQEEREKLLLRRDDILLQHCSGKIGMFRALSGGASVPIKGSDRDAIYAALRLHERKEELIDDHVRRTNPDVLTMDELRARLAGQPGVPHHIKTTPDRKIELWVFPEALRSDLKRLDSEISELTGGLNLTTTTHVMTALSLE